MLDRAHRLTASTEFAATIRRGRRAGTSTLVAHLGAGGEDPSRPARLGLVVGRAVGGSVVRSTVKRRVRHVVRPRLDALPPGSVLVLRALPPASGASSAELGQDLDRALRRLLPQDTA